MPEICCGIDEAGRGPVIGPMVMAIVCSDEETMSVIGARDSKTLSPNSRENLFVKIKERALSVNFRIVNPSEINEMMNIMTLNEIEEKVSINLIKEYGRNRIYVDAFDVNEQRLSMKLTSATGINVICKHKGDVLFPVVSAASIIAKVIRDREIREITRTYGDVGSGYPSDPKTIQFLKTSIREGRDLTPIIRNKWSTYLRIMKEEKQRRL